MTLRLGIAGAAGRMGRRITDLACADPAFQVAYGYVLPGEVGDKRMSSGNDLLALGACDVVIDFSAPEGSLLIARQLAASGTPSVVGTTGFTGEQEVQVRGFSAKVPIVKSPNMSLGVNVFFKIAAETARALPAYHVEIFETHHVHKKDAPSGTALQAGRVIEEAGGQKVAYHSTREGEVVGDHRIVFSSPGDRIEIFHHAESRDTFALGALQAAKWVVGQKPGLYTMRDVLGL